MLGISTTNARVGGFRGGILADSKTFYNRVIADGGTFEAENCLNTIIQDLTTKGFYSNAASILTANGVKANTLYSLLGTDWAVARNGVANRINFAGTLESMAANVARLQYQGGGGGCPSILAETQNTYLSLYNQDFSNAAWQNYLSTKTIISLANPFGNTSSCRITTVASGTLGSIYQAISSGSNKYCASVIAKKNTLDYVYILDVGGVDGKAWFNLNTGAIGTVKAGYTAQMIDLGNGWYYCGLFNNSNAAASYLSIGLTNADNSVNNASGSIDICYGDLSVNTILPSPRATTGATVTRLADVISQTRTFTANSTIFCKALLNSGTLADNTNYGIIDIRTASNNRISLYRYNNTFQLNVLNTSVLFSGSILTIPTLVRNTVYKFAIVITASTLIVYCNGTAIYTNNSLSVPTLNSASVYYGSLNGVNQWNGLLGEQINYDSAFNSTNANSLTT
jgi:hypothetical protein